MTNRGAAYIHYRDPADAESAIAHMHEAQLDGAVLSVSIILPRRTFSRSPPPATRPSRTEYGGGRYGGGRGSAFLDSGRPPPPLSSRYRSPPGRGRFRGGRAADRHDIYRPRSVSRSHSPVGRARSPSYSSRSPSVTPPRMRRSRRDSPPRRRRSLSYSSVSNRSLSRSPSRTRGRYGR